MVGRKLDEEEPESHPVDAVTFRWPRNWTAVLFFGCLASLHLGIDTTALLTFRFEAHMSLIFGTMFAGVALACLLIRREIVLEPEFRQLVLRTGVGRLSCVRSVPFDNVTSVRVTLLGRFHQESSVSIVCDHTDIELPPTPTPRQEGLLLAMSMNVRLVKVYGDGPPPEPAQRIAKLYRNEDAI